jgi:hypothetical protein
MKELDLNQLLRYGFAGVIFIFVLALEYKEPRCLLLDKDMSGTLAIVLSATALTVGCVIYTLHRAILFLLFLYLLPRLFDRGSVIKLDIDRWKHSIKKTNTQGGEVLQPKMDEWAAQVHFLYCIGWAILLAWGLGGKFGCTPIDPPIPKIGYLSFTIWSIIVFLVAAIVHHARYQYYEKQVFVEDV